MEGTTQTPAITQVDPNGGPDMGACLESIGMRQYAELFSRHSIGFEQATSLTESDLAGMGVEAVGHRKTILTAIAKIQAERSAALQSEAHAARRASSLQWLKRYFLFWPAAVGVLYTIATLTGPTRSDSDGFAFNELITSLFLGLAVGLAVLVYFLPSVVSFHRRHEYRWAILIANGFLGITGIVWLVLMGFSLGLFGAGATVALTYFADRKD